MLDQLRSTYSKTQLAAVKIRSPGIPKKPPQSFTELSNSISKATNEGTVPGFASFPPAIRGAIASLAETSAIIKNKTKAFILTF